MVNLGGTAIGTGLARRGSTSSASSTRCASSPASGFARAENLVEATQNADVFVEVSGILKALAANLLKICRRPAAALAPGPEAGLGEIRLPAAPGRLVDHARQGQPGHPRGRQPGGHAGDGLRPDHRRRPSPPAASNSTRSCRWSPTACSRACDLLAARLRHPAPALRRGHRGRRGALPRSTCATARRRSPRWSPAIGYDAACDVAAPSVRDSRAATHPRRCARSPRRLPRPPRSSTS